MERSLIARSAPCPSTGSQHLPPTSLPAAAGAAEASGEAKKDEQQDSSKEEMEQLEKLKDMDVAGAPNAHAKQAH